MKDENKRLREALGGMIESYDLLLGNGVIITHSVFAGCIRGYFIDIKKYRQVFDTIQ